MSEDALDRKDNIKRGRHESPASDADRSNKNPRIDSFEALDEKVRDKLRALFDQGLVQEDELDDSILRRLSEVDPKEAVECLEQFSHCDLSRVRNKSAYIVGVMRRVRAPEHQSNFQPNQNRNTTLHDSIKLKLNALYNDGVCKPTDIDEKCLDKMAQLPIPCAIEALTQLANRDLSDIRSISRFLMSIINRVEQQYNSGDRRATQTQPQIPIAGLGLIAPTPVDYTAALQPAVLPGIYPGLFPQFVNGKRNYAVEQLKMGVRVDEFHALSPHAPNIHPAIALKLQELWDSGVKLVAIIDDRVWGTLASMRAPEALICIEEMANQLNRIKNPNAYFMSMVRQYESHGLNTGRDKADGRFGNNGGRAGFQNLNRSGGNEACEELSTLHQDVQQKIEEIVQVQNLYLRIADFDRGICYALAKLDSAAAVNLLSEFAEQPLENVNNMPAFIMSFIRRRQH